MNSGRFDEIVSWRRWSGPPSPPATPPPPTGCHPGPLECGGCSIRSRQRWRPPKPRSSRVERTSPRPNRPPVSLPRAILPQAACARSICPAEPEPGSGDDLPWWLMTQFLEHVYQGSLSEISEIPSDSPVSRCWPTPPLNRENRHHGTRPRAWISSPEIPATPASLW